jgi:hypothetical protein
MKAVQLDFTIKTVENELTIDELQSHIPYGTADYSEFVASVLSKFSEL